MDDLEKTLIETEQRSKSNMHRIDSLEKDITSIKEDQKAIYKIATSVEVIAERMTHIEEKVDETGKKVDAQAEAWNESEKRLTEKISEAENGSSIRVANNVNSLRLAIITAVCTALATGILTNLLGLF